MLVRFISQIVTRGGMATSKTGSFTLVERVNSTTATAGVFQGTLDLGSIVDVGDQQAFAVESVDFIVQRYVTATGIWSGDLTAGTTSDCAFDMQLSDLNPGTAIIPADSNELIASALLQLDDTAGVYSRGPDLYPDNFGKLDESRMVVNDQLYFVIDASAAPIAGVQWAVTARVRGRIVKLATKDWMAIAIQSTASDN